MSTAHPTPSDSFALSKSPHSRLQLSLQKAASHRKCQQPTGEPTPTPNRGPGKMGWEAPEAFLILQHLTSALKSCLQE